MKVSDFIVEFLISKGITDVFGYPGGMVIHLMDSLDKYSDKIKAHLNYHEQASAFAACAYAQVSGKPGVAYATSGPGATNLITGICNAYFDSIPTIFITGQVNTNEAKGKLPIRQRGFQETEILSMVGNFTKRAIYVDNAECIKRYLEEAYFFSMEGRKGPVVLDIPMNIQRAEIEPDELEGFTLPESDNLTGNETKCAELIYQYLNLAKKPCFLIGCGCKTGVNNKTVVELIERLGIPVVTSMPAFDVLSKNSKYNYGFIGAYGDRTANFIVAKCDLLIVLGSRMDIRQVGINRNDFAKDAKIIRIDIDEGELKYKVHEDEIAFKLRVENIVKQMRTLVSLQNKRYSQWINVCDSIRNKLSCYDCTVQEKTIETISNMIADNTIITTDVGQNQIWVAQAFQNKENQKILFSGGHGAMGYALPAAIGAYYASKRPVVCF